MKWFVGEILEAINTAKSKNSIFVVFVVGSSEDEMTTKLNEALEDQELVSMFDDMVCIKVENGTSTCNQFSQIYPVILIPSVFFIDSATGVDLEITGGVVTKDSLKTSVEKALSKNKQASEPPAASERLEASTPLEASATATPLEASLPLEESSTPASSENIQSRMENAVNLLNEQMPVPTGSVVSHSTPTTLEDRVERAKRLLAERKEAKRKEEAEEEKRRERERRNVGQEMREAKKKREEEEVMKAAKERRKDKADDKAAMEAVRAQIAQDREERKARYDTEKAAEMEKRKEAEKKALAERAAEADRAVRQRCQVARLQFRLPDGRCHTHQFPASSPLSTVYEWVETELVTGFTGGFALSTTFPRRNLDDEVKTTSLKELEMAPSSTVLVLPVGGGGGGSVLPAGGLMSILTLLMTPFTVLYALIMSFFNTGPPQGETSRRGNTDRRAASGVRQEGNVSRLRNDNDEDDETNTWNGNSTQQM